MNSGSFFKMIEKIFYFTVSIMIIIFMMLSDNKDLAGIYSISAYVIIIAIFQYIKKRR